MRAPSLLFCLLFSLPVLAQTPKRGTVPLAGKLVLSEAEDPFNAAVISLEAPAPDGNVDKARLRAVKAEVERRFPARSFGSATASQKTTAAQPPIISRGFLADSLPGIPPDNYMAISKGGNAISVVNSSIAVLNDTGKMLSRKTLSSFTSAVGLPGGGPGGSNNYRYDPKVGVRVLAPDRMPVRGVQA